MGTQESENASGQIAPTALFPAPESMQFKGTHVLADLYGIAYELLNDRGTIAVIFEEAIRKGGATLLGLQIKEFEPHGLTAVAVLSESHASIHTYPEKGSAFLDVFTCGDCDPGAIANEIASQLGATVKGLQRIERGQRPSVEDGFEPANVTNKKANQEVEVDTLPSRTIAEEFIPGIDRLWEVEEFIAKAKTPYQDVSIVRTALGATLFSGQERQSSEMTQHIYHEGQIVPAALMTDSIERVLIIGSSEGVVSQMTEQMGAKEIIHVDIDESCVRLCAEFLPYGYTLADIENSENGKGPTRLLFEDGYAFVNKCVEAKEKFDIIVMDLPEEQLSDAQHNKLYQEEFLANISALLTPHGAYITQAGPTTLWRNETLVRCIRRTRNVFETTAIFEMEEQEWAWVIGCNFECDDVAKRMSDRLQSLTYKPEYIDGQSIQKATIIPTSIRRQLDI